jgi:hypothetical protein
MPTFRMKEAASLLGVSDDTFRRAAGAAPEPHPHASIAFKEARPEPAFGFWVQNGYLASQDQRWLTGQGRD